MGQPWRSSALQLQSLPVPPQDPRRLRFEKITPTAMPAAISKKRIRVARKVCIGW